MKKILRTIILLTVCCSVMIISGCASDPWSSSAHVSDSDTGSDFSNVPEPDAGFDLAPISEIRENFAQSVKEIRTGKFVNLDFSKAEFSFPEIDSISELSLSVPSWESPREMYVFICESLDILLPGVFSDEEKLDIIRFRDDNMRSENESSLTIDKYELRPAGENIIPTIKDNKCFMQVLFGTLQWFVGDDLNRWSGKEGVPILDSLGDNHLYDNTHAVDYVTDLNCTDKYELINGEMSIKDAAEFVNNFLETTVFSPYEQDAKTKLLAVDVVDIGDGKYGYGFLTAYEYNGVLFDYPEMKGVVRGRGIENDYDNRRYADQWGAVSMIQTDTVFHFISPVLGYSIKEVETYTSAITLQDAANIISGFFSDYMNFTVTRVEPVYLTYENASVPCWKFLMRCSGEVYNTFVDIQTGEVHLYVQK